MQVFGLVSMVVTVGLIAWFVSLQFESPSVSETAESELDNHLSYIDAVEEARQAVEQAGDKGVSSVVIYDDIAVKDNVRTLDLSGKSLTGSLKAEIRHLSELRELNISNNNLTGLPAEIGQLTKLEILNLSGNPLTGLPYELGNLKNLKTLDLRGTEYSQADLVVIKESLSPSVSILIE